MDRLKKGILKFQRSDFHRYQSLFTKLEQEQQPHTLFIGCSDSRVVPSLITKTNPGELFIVRNIANIVPPYAESEKYNSTSSAIEYAVLALEVDTIVVCGHSNCGGCAALFYDKQRLKEMPHIRKWLSLSHKILPLVDELLEDKSCLESRAWITEQLNAYMQLEHLMSYPFIRQKVEQGLLELHAWHYVIPTGEVFCFNKNTGFFEPICC